MADSVYRVTELVGVSTESWEDAARRAVETASGTLRDLRVAEVVKLDLTVEDGKVARFRTRLALSFKYEPGSTDRLGDAGQPRVSQRAGHGVEAERLDRPARTGRGRGPSRSCVAPHTSSRAVSVYGSTPSRRTLASCGPARRARRPPPATSSARAWPRPDLRRALRTRRPAARVDERAGAGQPLELSLAPPEHVDGLGERPEPAQVGPDGPQLRDSCAAG